MKTVLVAELWNEDSDSVQLMAVAATEESMDAWVKATWGNPVRWPGNTRLEGYELRDKDGKYLGFDLIISEKTVL